MPKAGRNLRSLSCRAKSRHLSKLLTHALSEKLARDSSTALGMTETRPRQFLCFSAATGTLSECAALLDLVCGNLELVAVGIAEINGVRDFVILEFEFDSALL